MDLKGHGVALITPFDDNGQIDFDSFKSHIDNLIFSKINYLVVLGTTAEVSTLSISEQVKISNFVIEINNGRVPLIIGIGGNHTKSVIDKIKIFNINQFQAILSVCPYYNSPNQIGLYKHFSEISKHCQIPLILYNVPSRTGINIKPITVLDLANNHDNIIGIKEANNNIKQINELIYFSSNKIQVVSGNDLIASESIINGAKGVISVIGNALPKKFNQLVDLSINKYVTNVSKKNKELINMINLIYEEGSPSGIKALLSQMGMCNNVLRLPLVKVSDMLYTKISEELKFFI